MANKDKNNLTASILFFCAFICLLLSSYGHFYDGNKPLGYLCLITSILELISSIINYIKDRKKKNRIIASYFSKHRLAILTSNDYENIKKIIEKYYLFKQIELYEKWIKLI